MAAVARIADPYVDTHVIDRRAPRTNQAIVGLGALAAAVLGLPVIVALLALQLIVGLTLGRRYCLPCRLWFDVLQPRFGEGPLEDSRPPRFANVLGATFLTASTLAYVAGLATVGAALALIVAALALLAASTGICVGCEVYVRGLALLHRLRGGEAHRAEPGALGLAADRPGIVLFTSPYCLACQDWSERLGAGDVPFARVDVKEHPALAAGHGITSTPTLLLVAPDGAEIRRLDDAAADPAALVAALA